MKEFTEDVITKTVNPKHIDLTKVHAAGFDTNYAASGSCPKCKGRNSAKVFIKNHGEHDEFILACPNCGCRVQGWIGSTKFNAWLDRNIERLDEERNNTNTPLLKKVLTRRKDALRVLYR